MTRNSNRLPALAADIRAAHAAVGAFARFSAERAMAAGAMLIEARTLVPHGDWANWLREHVGFSERTARRYAQLARSGLKLATVAEMGIRGAAESLARVNILVPTGAQTVVVQSPTVRAFIWPSLEHPGFYNVMAFDAWLAGAEGPALGAEVVTLRRPVRASGLALFLPGFGIDLDEAEIRVVTTIDHDWLTPISTMEPQEINRCAALAAAETEALERALRDANDRGEYLAAEAVIDAARALSREARA